MRHLPTVSICSGASVQFVDFVDELNSSSDATLLVVLSEGDFRTTDLRYPPFIRLGINFHEMGDFQDTVKNLPREEAEEHYLHFLRGVAEYLRLMLGENWYVSQVVFNETGDHWEDLACCYVPEKSISKHGFQFQYDWNELWPNDIVD